MTREEVTNSEGYKVTKAALEWYENNQDLDAIDAFEAGAAWQYEQFRKIENCQEEGWYSSHDDEYVCGISFDEPIKLPVEFYYKEKEE